MSPTGPSTRGSAGAIDATRDQKSAALETPASRGITRQDTREEMAPERPHQIGRLTPGLLCEGADEPGQVTRLVASVLLEVAVAFHAGQFDRPFENIRSEPGAGHVEKLEQDETLHSYLHRPCAAVPPLLTSTSQVSFDRATNLSATRGATSAE